MAGQITYDKSMALVMQVRDMRASIQWYRSRLGFEPMCEMGDMGWCELNTSVPGLLIGLSRVESPKVGSGAVPAFGVKDLDAARALLEADGVVFTGPTHIIEGLVKLATLHDPDGNPITLCESLSQQP